MSTPTRTRPQQQQQRPPQQRPPQPGAAPSTQQQQQRSTTTTTLSLVSAGPHRQPHIFRIQNPKYEINNLAAPLKMVRDYPPEKPSWQQQREAKAEAELAAKLAAGIEVPVKEKMDPTKIAPFGGSKPAKVHAFKKKTKQLFMGKTEDGEDPLRKVWKRDPDRFPWLLTDGKEEVELVGHMENQRANYMLFFFPDADDKLPAKTFLVKPAKKWYRFNTKPTYKTLTTEEAEERMKKLEKSKLPEKWSLKKEPSLLAEAERIDGVPVKKEDVEIMKRNLKKNSMRTAFGAAAGGKSRKSGENLDGEEEADYDEVISDDENPDFGIENEEEAKEAKKREFDTRIDRADFGDGDEDEDVGNKPKGKATGTVKTIKKALKKFEKDVYVSDDEQNPYGDEEEEEDSDEEAEAAQKEAEAQKEKEKQDPASGSTKPSTESKASSSSVTKVKVKRELDSHPSASQAKKAKKASSESKPGSPALVKNVKASTPSLGRSTSVGGQTVSASKPGSPNLPGGGGSPTLASGGTKIKIKMSGMGSGSPDVKRKVEEDDGQPSAKRPRVGAASPEIPPAPLSAAEIIKEDRKKRAAMKAASSSAKSPDLLSAPSSTGATRSPIPQQSSSSPSLLKKATSGASAASAASSKASPNVVAGGKVTPNVVAAGGKVTPNVGKSTSPALSSQARASPAISSGGTPLVGREDFSENSDTFPSTPVLFYTCIHYSEDKLTRDDVLNLLQSPNPPTVVKDLIAALREKMSKHPENKDRIRDILKELCTIKNGKISLKK
ncbi:hypothetical protein HDU76_003981 [Blyttiomyces sp. JEL0837]|nr:hypothetical protein HDU76_003981 [Blyttiomyces sp. JEL0837]